MAAAKVSEAGVVLVVATAAVAEVGGGGLFLEAMLTAC